MPMLNQTKTKQRRARAAAEQRQLDHALSRIDYGLYPLCERCGARIEMERLRERPQTTVCDSCADR